MNFATISRTVDPRPRAEHQLMQAGLAQDARGTVRQTAKPKAGALAQTGTDVSGGLDVALKHCAGRFEHAMSELAAHLGLRPVRRKNL